MPRARRFLVGVLTLAALMLDGSHAAARTLRTHTLYVPKSAPATGKLPLIVVLSCYSCVPENVVDAMRVDEVADRHGVMLLLPDARVDKRGNRFWSATDACCNFDGASDEDVGFIAGLLDEMVAKRRVDPARIYLVGWSNGGYFAHRLACELAPRIAGIVSLAGANFAEPARCRASAPVAVVEVHGDADEVVRYDGGPLPRELTTSRIRSAGARASVATWARINGCVGEPVAAGVADLDDKLAGDETRIETYRGCKRPVELWTVHGGGHGLSLTAAFGERMWGFLSAQRASGASGGASGASGGATGASGGPSGAGAGASRASGSTSGAPGGQASDGNSARTRAR